MSDLKRYLVVVRPPQSKQPDHAASYTVARPATIKFVKAANAESAAETVGVEPGAHALVIEDTHIERFDRPEQARLESRRADGSLLLQGMATGA